MVDIKIGNDEFTLEVHESILNKIKAREINVKMSVSELEGLYRLWEKVNCKRLAKRWIYERGTFIVDDKYLDELKHYLSENFIKLL